jgi:hypothetical protein
MLRMMGESVRDGGEEASLEIDMGRTFQVFRIVVGGIADHAPRAL